MQTNTSDVRGGDAVEILINDHNTIKQMLTRLTQVEQPQERMQALNELKELLTVHNATEENLVYPALNKVAHKKAESLKLYNETAEADILLFELDTMLKEGQDDGFATKAKKFQSAVLEHIEDEEGKAFPHLQKGAAPEQQQLLTQSVREFRSTFRPSGGSRSTTGEI